MSNRIIFILLLLVPYTSPHESFSPLWGAPEGYSAYFVDWDEDNLSRISRITICHSDDGIMGFQLTLYSSARGNRVLPFRGAHVGVCEDITFSADEYLYGITGSYVPSKGLMHLMFYTYNRSKDKRYHDGPYGVTEGIWFNSMEYYDPVEIRGITGFARERLYKIGVIVEIIDM